jgi:hypothetical protein
MELIVLLGCFDSNVGVLWNASTTRNSFLIGSVSGFRLGFHVIVKPC